MPALIGPGWACLWTALDRSRAMLKADLDGHGHLYWESSRSTNAARSHAEEFSYRVWHADQLKEINRNLERIKETLQQTREHLDQHLALPQPAGAPNLADEHLLAEVEQLAGA